MKIRPRRGFTLVEVLVVLIILSALLAVVLPILGKVRRQGRMVLKISNQRQITMAANSFSFDNDESYPESVAFIGPDDYWNWQEPMMMTRCTNEGPSRYRSMSAYLRDYIHDASVMVCPNGPRKYEYMQQAWDAGDDWRNPDTADNEDPLTGTYCFYWNYVGYLSETGDLFEGPWSPAVGRGQSKLLVSCYLGYDHWRNPGTYGSCEEFKGGGIAAGSDVSLAYWSCSDCNGLDDFRVKLHAGYTDGHVESFTASEVVPMKVIMDISTNEPYPDGMGMGPGTIYLPRNGIH